MKLKFIVALFLSCVLIMGAVNASENLTDDTISQSQNDDFTVDEIEQKEVLQKIEDKNSDMSSGDDKHIIQANNNVQNVLGDYSSEKVHIELESYVDISGKYYNLGYVQDSGGLKGTVTLLIDGKKVRSKTFTSGKTSYCDISESFIDLKKYGYGYHDVKLTYDDGVSKSDSRTVNFVSIPDVTPPSEISVGEKNGIIISDNAGLDGIATLFNRVITGYNEYNEPIYAKGDAILTVNILKGYAWIPLDGLTKGSHPLQLEYNYGTYEDVYPLIVNVRDNNPEFKSSLSATTIIIGDSITAKLIGPKADGYANIYVDNGYFKSVRFNFGSMEEVISGLSIGAHRITIQYTNYDSNLFYSITYYVVVKDHTIKLKLNKVKVKKSAKKLVIKATLKIDGKAVKYKKLNFKFNKIKYTARTNKNGVAKITIPKSVLKKLKKGKKVKYQVTYGKKTVKLSTKVKK